LSPLAAVKEKVEILIKMIKKQDEKFNIQIDLRK
jgi:hypothetical protein